MRRNWWIGLAAGAVLLAGAGMGAVAFANPLGQERQETPDATEPAGPTLLERTADELGITADELREAVRAATGEAIDEKVAAGDLTAEQAASIKERLAEAPDGALIGGHGFKGPHGPGFPGGPFGGRGGPGFDFKFGFGFGMMDGDDALAEFLGIEADALRTELQADGASLGSVAEAHGKSRDELKVFLLEKLTSKLDEAVANEDLTQKRADEIKAMAESHLDEVIDHEFGGGFRGRFMPAPGAMPNLDDAPGEGRFEVQVEELS